MAISSRLGDKYACEEKQQESRIPIWACLLENYRGGNVLILPEKTRRELDVLLAHGVQPNSILAVDKSPAVIATFTRTLTLSERAGIQRRGTLVSEACKSWARAGFSLEAAHFDFCANVEGYFYGSVRQELEDVARCGIIDHARIAVTVLKGRETRGLTKQFDRVALLTAALNNGLRGRSSVAMVDSRTYQNGPSPMLWVVFQIGEKR
jgi:hypothetical protein